MTQCACFSHWSLYPSFNHFSGLSAVASVRLLIFSLILNNLARPLSSSSSSSLLNKKLLRYFMSERRVTFVTYFTVMSKKEQSSIIFSLENVHNFSPISS